MIHLVYPTIYQEIIQKFAENGDIYWQFNFPGHDGLDFKAPFHSKVFAAADGIVSAINYDYEERFGLHIVIEHVDGYSTLYGYLGKANVAEGEKVKQNQVIALSGDSNNRGYIHFGLYNKTLERLKNSKYPNGELDPTPFMKYDKQNFVSKSIVKTKKNQGIGANYVNKSYSDLAPNKTQNYVFSHTIKIDRLKALKKNGFIVIVVDEEISKANQKPSQYLKSIRADIERCYQTGIRFFQIGKSPNITQNGMNSVWRSAGEFSNWWIDVCSPLTELFPDIRLGYPSLTQGRAVPGIKFDSKQFLLESSEAIEFSDWIGFEYIWQSRQELMRLIEQNELLTASKIAPSKARIITGYGQVDYLLSKDEQKQNYSEFEKWVKENDLADYLFKIVV